MVTARLWARADHPLRLGTATSSNASMGSGATQAAYLERVPITAAWASSGNPPSRRLARHSPAVEKLSLSSRS
jgi:hypothetical protein